MTTKPIIILGLALLAIQANAQEATMHKTTTDQASYALGVDMARKFNRQGMELDPDAFMKGLKDGLSREKLPISELELGQRLDTVQTEMRLRQVQLRGKTPAEANKQRAEAFLAENKEKPGVVALPSGLQYRVLKAGTGAKPTADQTVQCAYRATLIDGTEIICSNPGEPATFKVKEADMAGWREVLPLMSVGSKWQLLIPSKFAYGARGVGSKVGPNELILSELELVAIK